MYSMCIVQWFSNWGPRPPGGPQDGTRGGRKEILEFFFFFFFLPVCKSGFSYLNYDVFKKN